MSDRPPSGKPLLAEATFSVAAGGMAGVMSTLLTNPFDVMRSKMAASRSATGVEQKRLLSHLKVMRSDGLLRSVTAGIHVNLLASVPTNAIYLTAYRMLKRESENRLGATHVLTPVVAAFGAVGVTNATLAPAFTVRTRCQLDASVTARDVVANIVKTEGIRGFYRGALVNALGRMVEEATFWFLYENAKRLTNEGNMREGMMRGSLAVVGLSSLTKVVGSGVAYPYNVVMTHLREVDKVTKKPNHHHFWPTVQYVYRQDGAAGFYKGAGPHLVRCALSKASQVWTFEFLMVAGAYLYTTDGKRPPKSS